MQSVLCLFRVEYSRCCRWQQHRGEGWRSDAGALPHLVRVSSVAEKEAVGLGPRAADACGRDVGGDDGGAEVGVEVVVGERGCLVLLVGKAPVAGGQGAVQLAQGGTRAAVSAEAVGANGSLWTQRSSQRGRGGWRGFQRGRSMSTLEEEQGGAGVGQSCTAPHLVEGAPALAVRRGQREAGVAQAGDELDLVAVGRGKGDTVSGLVWIKKGGNCGRGSDGFCCNAGREKDTH